MLSITEVEKQIAKVGDFAARGKQKRIAPATPQGAVQIGFEILDHRATEFVDLTVTEMGELLIAMAVLYPLANPPARNHAKHGETSTVDEFEIS